MVQKKKVTAGWEPQEMQKEGDVMVQKKKVTAGWELQEIQNVYDLQNIFKYLRWSGKYDNSKSTLSVADFRIEKERIRVLREPVYKINSPVVLHDQPEITYKPWSITNVTLHVDIDGTDPLAVVSGTISKQTMYTFGAISRHFIGQVTSRSGLLFADQTLVVENFEFNWPTTSTVVNRCDIVLSNIFNQNRVFAQKSG